MMRKIVLLAGTFGTLLAAVLLYQFFAEQASRLTRSDPGRLNPMAQSGPGDRDSGEGEELFVVQRDKDGRLRSIYRARKWTKLQGASYMLKEPVVEVVQADGQRVHVRGDEGLVVAEEVRKGAFNPRQGMLKGNVRIIFDRSTEADAAPPEQRSDDPNLIKIFVDELYFDNDLLSIDSNSQFALFSPEADIIGKGISISWHDAPRELRRLVIHEGEQMVIKSVPEELDVISLPGGKATDQARPPETALPVRADHHGAAATRVVTRPVAESSPATQAAATSPVTQPVASSEPADLPAGAPGTAPASTSAAASRPESGPAVATRPADRHGTKAPKVSSVNMYVAEFSDANRLINVDSGDRKLHGAEKLTLTFDWTRGPGRQAESRPATAPATASAPSTRPATGPTTTTSAPAKRRSAPMIVTWTGPLVISPAHTDDPVRNHFIVVAEGSKVVLSDSRTAATCRRFVFDNPEEQGTLEGTKEEPVRLVLTGGEEVVCEHIDFDRRAGEAVLLGPGTMTSRSERLGTLETSTGPATRPESAPEPAVAYISWTESVGVAFGEERITRPDGSVQATQYIRDAVFRGDVEANQPRTGDFMRCEMLETLFDHGRGRAEYLSRAIAIGSVTARQEARDIQADRLTVDFDEVQEKVEAGKTRWRTRPTKLVAEGKVKVGEQRKDGREPLLAWADRIDSNLLRRSAVLEGRPAEVSQGVNRMKGPKIYLDETSESAVVDGQGTLDFKTDKNFSGGRLPEPRLVTIDWTNRMKYLGKWDTAVFDGNVMLRSGLDEMQCRTMNLMFDPPVTTQPATATSRSQPAVMPVSGPTTLATAKTRPAAAGKERDRRLGLDVENFSGRRIAILYLDKAVRVDSSRLDEKDQMIQRMQLKGDQLTYDAKTDQVTVNGHGTFLSEDYRPPRSDKEAEGGAETLDRPSQTAFEWNKLMNLAQKDRRVVMEGQVKMIHHSGRYLLPTEGLKLPPWPELKEGRLSKVACDRMIAKFAPPAQKAPTTATSTASKPVVSRPASDWISGPAVGALEQFTALKDVNMEDGVRQKRTVQCQRLIYDRPTDVVEVFGALENQAPSNARMIVEDLDAGTSTPYQSPRIIWYRKNASRTNERIVTEKLTGAGGV